MIDVCQFLTESDNPKNYWNMLKSRLRTEGNETYTNCVRLKLKASDGKMRKTDCANTEQLLRIIQSIPSKKAEPFKQWLAKVGAERLDEVADPEKAIERAVSYYQQKGYKETESVTRTGGQIAANARKELEEKLGRSIISSLNATSPRYLDDSPK